jgi:glycosyltransferase involved in cell wall biosynthesis
MLPLVSILTPTWNRGDYLDRVWNGLNSQTYKNIEWIVSDDGSTDNTAAKLNELRGKSSFRMIIISASVHIGKSRMDNEAVKVARGAFILWNDSDDYLVPQAIEQLVSTWISIPDEDRNDFVGVTALCGNDHGVISSQLPTEGIFDTTWNDLRVTSQVSGDMLYFTRSDLLKEKPFPEIDFLVPEGVVWTSIGNMRTRVLPKVLKIVQYGASNCISFSKKMEYCRGKAFAIAVMGINLEKYPKKFTCRLWDLITLIRYCVHGEISFRDAIHLWRSNSAMILIVLMVPFALVLVFKDVLQRKVKKTHREFHLACKSVVVLVDDADI